MSRPYSGDETARPGIKCLVELERSEQLYLAT
jgi:hypothetical protein